MTTSSDFIDIFTPLGATFNQIFNFAKPPSKQYNIKKMMDFRSNELITSINKHIAETELRDDLKHEIGFVTSVVEEIDDKLKCEQIKTFLSAYTKDNEYEGVYKNVNFKLIFTDDNNCALGLKYHEKL